MGKELKNLQTFEQYRQPTNKHNEPYRTCGKCKQ